MQQNLTQKPSIRVKPLNPNMKLWVYDIPTDVVEIATKENSEGKPVFPALNMKNARKKADKIKADFQNFEKTYQDANDRLKAKSEHSAELLEAERSDTEGE